MNRALARERELHLHGNECPPVECCVLLIRPHDCRAVHLFHSIDLLFFVSTDFTRTIYSDPLSY